MALHNNCLETLDILMNMSAGLSNKDSVKAHLISSIQILEIFYTL